MHPALLGQMVQLEHTRRLHEAQLAAVRHPVGEDDDEGTHARQPGRLARLLAMRPHRHLVSAGANAAQVS